MRLTTLKMPQLGESVTEGTVDRWLKREGELVRRDEPIVEVVTDKVNAEIPSPVEGRLVRIKVAPGETVPIGAALAELEVEGASVDAEEKAEPGYPQAHRGERPGHIADQRHRPGRAGAARRRDVVHGRTSRSGAQPGNHADAFGSRRRGRADLGRAAPDRRAHGAQREHIASRVVAPGSRRNPLARVPGGGEGQVPRASWVPSL